MERKNQLVALIFSLVLVIGLVGSFLGSPGEAFETLTEREGSYGSRVEAFLKKNLPFREELQKWKVSLKLISGLKEIDSIFFTENRLIENLTVEDPAIGPKNIDALRRFGSLTDPAPTLMFIPTASCIHRPLLPKNAILFDQAGFLEQSYHDLHRSFYTVDAYDILSACADENLFYRTESLPSQLAGYKLYAALGERLSYTPLPLSDFAITPLRYDCYGTLYARWGNGGVRGDAITAYLPAKRSPSYRVLHSDPGGVRATYYTLYPLSASMTGQDMDCILGGLSPRIDIENYAAFPRRLLVLGDRYALPLLPFLSLHYSEIAFLSPADCSDTMMEALAAESFDQVLVLSSVEGILNEDWSAALEAYRVAVPPASPEEPDPDGPIVVIPTPAS